MSEFVPHKIDAEESFESSLLGDVKAGFPSPAEDIREKLDLIKLLVRHKASTFFFRVSGVSMVDTGMDEGDIIIVDRAIDPYNNCKAVCFIDGEYTVKRVEIHDKGVRLMPGIYILCFTFAFACIKCCCVINAAGVVSHAKL